MPKFNEPQPDCFKPEKDNPYPLCVGEYTLSPANKDQKLILADKCKDCCLYKDYETYHDPYEPNCEGRLTNDKQ